MATKGGSMMKSMKKIGLAFVLAASIFGGNIAEAEFSGDLE